MLSLSGRKVDLVEAKKGERARFATRRLPRPGRCWRYRLRRAGSTNNTWLYGGSRQWSSRPSPTGVTA